MTPRIYTNPFVKDSAPQSLVSLSEWEPAGRSYYGDIGVCQSYTRTATYADGTTLREQRDDMHPIWEVE